MKRFLILLLIVSLTGCSGEKKEGDKSSGTGDGDKTGTATADAKKPNRGGGDSSTSTGSRVRTEGFFGRTKELNDMNKMKLVALAIHNFHDTFKQFPMAKFKDEKMARHESLSWRVALIPFGDFMHEFDQFDKKQAWDSEKNKAMVNAKSKDQYVLSNGNLVCAIKNEPQARSFRDLLDGSSNTVMLLENPTAKADEWSKSVDLTSKDAVKIVKSLKKGEYLLAVMYDGSTAKIHSLEGKSLTEKDLEAVFGHRDGTPTKQDIFHPAK